MTKKFPSIQAGFAAPPMPVIAITPAIETPIPISFRGTRRSSRKTAASTATATGVMATISAASAAPVQESPTVCSPKFPATPSRPSAMKGGVNGSIALSPRRLPNSGHRMMRASVRRATTMKNGSA
jgi:hypothetical protein